MKIKIKEILKNTKHQNTRKKLLNKTTKMPIISYNIKIRLVYRVHGVKPWQLNILMLNTQ